MNEASRRSVAESNGAARALRSPLYHQIYLVLRQQILDGVYPYDGRLPSEQDLTVAYGVSRITAKRALDELATEGLVLRERARGTRVAYRAPAAPFLSSQEGSLENLLAMGLETEVRLVDLAYVPASGPVAEALACRPGDMVQRAVRVRTFEEQPFSYLETYVPEDIGRQFDAEDLAKQPLLVLLERSGVVVDGARQTMSATLADAVVAAELEVEVGAALLKIRRVVNDAEGRPVEYITGLYRPDRYQQSMVLSRVRGKERNTWSPREEPQPL